MSHRLSLAAGGPPGRRSPQHAPEDGGRGPPRHRRGHGRASRSFGALSRSPTWRAPGRSSGSTESRRRPLAGVSANECSRRRKSSPSVSSRRASSSPRCAAPCSATTRWWRSSRASCARRSRATRVNRVSLGMLDDGLGRVLAGEAGDAVADMDDALRVMTPRVEVRPSGREFFVEGHDSLLQSGLKAGLRLSYGCGNGTCGLCRCRVVDGEVQRIRAHDFALSDAERAQGHILMCAYSAVTDLKIETLEAAGPQDIPRQEIVTTVRAVSALDAETRLLHLQTPRSTRLRFLAGQSASLGAATAAGDVHAAYPIASCPCDDRNLHFHIGRDEADAFARRRLLGAHPVRRRGDARGPGGRLRARPRGGKAPRLPRLRPGLRPHQEPRGVRALGRCRRLLHGGLARHAPRRPLPRQPVPRVGRGPRRLRLDPRRPIADACRRRGGARRGGCARDRTSRAPASTSPGPTRSRGRPSSRCVGAGVPAGSIAIHAW